MSGGFFRGTSADQDTRFSNKQAKLLKSQKFAPELDQLVDMTRVKLDVIRPWIATRVTELLGFEDEVLINFVYGLLDGKEVDGKQIQIQLTGFMEKNTGKFMRELWGLLLSAQNNVSGVPQQFLDAKEEETKKKKAETDRIAHEIQRRRDRDGGGHDRQRKSRFDGEANSMFTSAASDSISKFSKTRDSSVQPEEVREVDGRHGSRAKNGYSRSPPPEDHSQSPSRSRSKSISRSRSYSGERHKSRSLSVSSQSPRLPASPRRHYQSPKRRSRSPKRRNKSPPRLSVSPRRRRSISPRRRRSPRVTRSPSRRRSPPLRRRSRSRQRSPSPFRYRSHLSRRGSPRRRSPSPWRSPSPHRRRSPLHRRLPSPPPRRRSPSPPSRRMSPSPPSRRRSPPPASRRRSPSPPPPRRSPSPPSRRRSSLKPRRRSPSPIRRRSPVPRSLSPGRGSSESPLRRRSPPPRSPKQRQRSPLHLSKSRRAGPSVSPPQRKRSVSLDRSQQSIQNSGSLSKDHDTRVNGNETRRYRDEETSKRANANKSPTNDFGERDLAEGLDSKRKISKSAARRVSSASRSPHCDAGNHSGDHKKMLVGSRENSVSNSESPTDMRNENPRPIKRSRSLSKSPVKQTSKISRHDYPTISKEEKYTSRSREDLRHRTNSNKRRKHLVRDVSPILSPDKREFSLSPAAQHGELKKKQSRVGSEVSFPQRNVQQSPYSSEELEYAPGRAMEERKPKPRSNDKQRSTELLKGDAALDRVGYKEQLSDQKRNHQRRGDENDIMQHGTEPIKKKLDKRIRADSGDSDSEDTSSCRNESVDKRRHKKSDKRKRGYDETSDSDSLDTKKEAKRRRKDEKRQRKEERRRRREERHRRKLERKAGKMKRKSVDAVSPPSEFGGDQGYGGDSDADGSRKKNSHLSDVEEAETEQKKLEIELREKALESLRAKKAISQ